MMTGKTRWILRGEAFDAQAEAAGGISPILVHLLERRKLADGACLESFLRPRLKDLSDPFGMTGVGAAVERVLRAVDAGERVCVFGDYDVDGVSSVALMCGTLRAYGVEARPFIPVRSGEGYGLSVPALARCLAEGPVPDLLISVDCGTVSVAEIAGLRGRGVDVIVVDHHEPGPDGLPDAVAVVNPKVDGNWDYLCAAGVVFKLAHALFKRRPVEGVDLRDWLDLVAVATIADIVPMVGENRLLVRHGLKRLGESGNRGLLALQEVSGLQGLPTSMDVGFRIGPRLNAAGRMDAPLEALEILMTEDDVRARQLALRLDGYNRERQQLENAMREEAQRMLEEDFDPENDPVIVLGRRGWHAGVVGIVASRLMRRYHKPAFVIAIDDQGVGKGSGRSIEGVSLVDAIEACRSHVIAGGGHGMAAGISIREEEIDGFRRAFGKYVMETTDEALRMPKLWLDAELSFAWLSLDFLSQYELLQPFGNGNPQPVFLAREVRCVRMQVMKNQHLRLILRQSGKELDAVYFGGGAQVLPDGPWDVAFTIDRNTYRGRTSLQLVIQAVRAAGSGPV